MRRASGAWSLLDGVTLQWCQDPDVLLGGLAAVIDASCCTPRLNGLIKAALSLSIALIDPARRVVGPQLVPLRLCFQ